jgi:hypothetical protein
MKWASASLCGYARRLAEVLFDRVCFLLDSSAHGSDVGMGLPGNGRWDA